MVRTSWPPQTGKQENSYEPSLNASFNNSFNHNSPNGLPSPRKFISFHKRAPEKNNGTSDSDFEHVPRFALFDSKADIMYVPEEDQLAASVYADRFSTEDESKVAQKPRTSGYDFDNLLKDVEVENYSARKK